MKLYRIAPQGHYLPTQEQAKHACRNGAHSFSKVDVPTSAGRDELCAFLNDIVDEAAGQAALDTRAQVFAEERAPVTNVVPLVTPAQGATAHTAQSIVEFILDEAPVHLCENVLAALGTRIGELAKARRHG